MKYYPRLNFFVALFMVMAMGIGSVSIIGDSCTNHAFYLLILGSIVSSMIVHGILILDWSFVFFTGKPMWHLHGEGTYTPV